MFGDPDQWLVFYFYFKSDDEKTTENKKWLNDKEANKTETKDKMKKKEVLCRLELASDKWTFYWSGKLDLSSNHSSVPS